MRSQNIKHNPSGKVVGAGCLLLLLLTFCAINPMMSLSAFAKDEDVAEDGIMTLADTPSTVGISFSPASGSASLSPTTSAGQSAQINVLATVSVANSGGYSVYLKSNSTNLVGKKSSANVIPGAMTAKTYANMDVNTWGYYAREGSSVPEGATYKAVSVSGNGDKLAENTNNKIASDTKSIMLSFAAKVNDTKPADTYQNTVTMSVVSSPLQTTLTDISDMQSMTNEICSASAMYETKQLKDTRDGKYYWVTKLADSKCWMTQNLDLDLSTGTALTSATSDVSSNWTPGYSTATTASSSTTLADNTGQRSWSLGNYRITNPTTPNSCGYPKNSAADCSSQFTAYNTPTSANGDANAHYILGNHYQWNAATAGTGGTITSGQATSSICPKGWKLPVGNKSGEFQALINADSIGSDVAKLTSSPYYFVRGGSVWQDNGLFADAGIGGLYWSSTPDSNSDAAYTLYFSRTNTLDPSSGDRARRLGLSVRCVAR